MEASNSSNNAMAGSQAESPSRLKKIGRYTVIVILALMVISTIAERLWISSGSGEWELKIDEKGVKVYTMKVPGDMILKVKAEKNFNMSFSNILSPFLDENIQNECDKWVQNCIEYKILEQWDPKLQTNLQVWRVALPWPFSPREMVVQGQIRQDPKTKVVTLENIATPNRIPPTEGYVRVMQFHNYWHYYPLGNGEVRMELIQDFDMGGFFPDFLFNLAGPAQLLKMFDEELPVQLGQEKYERNKLDFIIEH